MRDQFRCMLKIENQELERLWAVSAIFFAFNFPWLRTIGAFLRVTKIDTISHDITSNY